MSATTPEDRAVGKGGCRGIAAGETYDCDVDKTLPRLFELVIMNDAGSISSIVLNDGTEITVNYLRSLTINGLWGVNVPITAPGGNLIKKVVSNTANIAAFTVIEKIG